MKQILTLLLILICTVCTAQKYALIDKKMSMPVMYANTLSVQDSYKGYFIVEKSKLLDFITEIENIAKILMDTTNKKPENINVNVGRTNIHGLKIQLATEDRIDVVLTTDYGDAKTTMHLCDAKVSNANNSFFVNTWLKYLHSYIK